MKMFTKNCCWIVTYRTLSHSPGDLKYRRVTSEVFTSPATFLAMHWYTPWSVSRVSWIIRVPSSRRLRRVSSLMFRALLKKDFPFNAHTLHIWRIKEPKYFISVLIYSYYCQSKPVSLSALCGTQMQIHFRMPRLTSSRIMPQLRI